LLVILLDFGRFQSATENISHGLTAINEFTDDAALPLSRLARDEVHSMLARP
jgi:hypothetical protein